MLRDQCHTDCHMQHGSWVRHRIYMADTHACTPDHGRAASVIQEGSGCSLKAALRWEKDAVSSVFSTRDHELVLLGTSHRVSVHSSLVRIASSSSYTLRSQHCFRPELPTEFTLSLVQSLFRGASKAHHSVQEYAPGTSLDPAPLSTVTQCPKVPM